MATTTSNRTAEAELDRQINFQQTMKDRALTKYLTKVAEIDAKIEALNTLKNSVSGFSNEDQLVVDGIVTKATAL